MALRIIIPFLLGSTFAQVRTYTDLSAIPTNVPIASDYTGPLRPQVHYSPPTNFMNDPNGMFLDSEGVYHLYYQYNPIEPIAGNQSWGHATSRDLYRWENQPIALLPINSSSLIFSGSAVVDTNNTSGFFPNQDNGVVAFFTIATTDPVSLQTQGIAYSLDNGYTYEMYDGNPVIDIGSDQFRDPKVIRYDDHWAMVIAYAADFTVGIFTSTNLRDWTHASNFSFEGWIGVQWECPNLVEIPVEGSDDTLFLMQISINPGSPLGGSVSQYFPGTFDGHTFRPVDGGARFTDFGKDNYAGQFFYGTPPGEPPIQIAWASNWEYTNLIPTGTREGWRSAMTVPRHNTLQRIGRDWALVQQPVDLSPITAQSLLQRDLVNTSAAVDYASVYSNALYIEANATEGISGGTLNFTFSSPVSAEYLQTGLTFAPQQPIWVNRRGLRGFDNVLFTDSFSQHTVNGLTSFQAIIDRSILEVFGNRGQLSATTTYFPNEPLTVLSVSAGGLQPRNASVSIAVYALEIGWKEYENDAGIVVGNVTAGAGNSTAHYHKRMVYKANFS